MRVSPSLSAHLARTALAAVGAATLAALLSGCGILPGVGEPAATVSPTQPAQPTPSAPSARVLVPDGSAEDNLALFDSVVQSVWASEERDSGRAYIDALVAAGFDRERMQVTRDRSTVDRPAESLQFSVAWGESQCLIGQVGPSTGEPVTAVMAQLAGGRCLIGATRPIDW